MCLFIQVMKRLNECSCKEKLKSERCGHGKFIIQPSTRDKKTTLYARVSIFKSATKLLNPRN